MRLMISGYGGASGHTAGVYDTQEKRFIWKSGIPAISFMCADTVTGTLFGAGEYSGYGKVYMFTPQPDGSYRLADTLSVAGGGLCHIAYVPQARLLAGACYENGDFFAVSVEDGAFGAMRTYARQGGDVPISRAHSAVFGKEGRYIYSANIALDRMYVYEYTDTAVQETGFTQLPLGVGPRHMLQARDKLHVITEYSNEIITLSLADPASPVVLGRTGTLPGGFTGTSYCSTLCASGDYLYAANRGANTIAVFKTGTDGTLTKTLDCSCHGDWPRHIAVVEGDGTTQLAIANERSGRVSLCPIDTADGSPGGEAWGIPFEGASFVAAW